MISEKKNPVKKISLISNALSKWYILYLEAPESITSKTSFLTFREREETFLKRVNFDINRLVDKSLFLTT